MPSKNVIRSFAEDQYLHVYNRGVEKRKIFLNEDDYQIFLYYLFIYLADPEIVAQKYPKLRKSLKNNNLFGKVSLLAFCLMPNHFHFLLYQSQLNGTLRFMKQLTNAYTRYFNIKYKRVGPLMQGRYKAVAIEEDSYLLHLSRYIHQNPLKINFVLANLKNYPWSSYPTYLGISANSFLHPREIMDYFSKEHSALSYQAFVEATEEITLPEPLELEAD